MTAVLCKIEDCEVARSGHCQLGHDPIEKCPNYAPDDLEIDPGDVEDEAPEVVSLPVPIASGNVIQYEDLADFCRANQIRTVALIGASRAGKTTLVASLYAMFLKGPFAGLSFSGSSTLMGFAQRHALALLNSGRTDPTTPRTSRSDSLNFFHLALSDGDGAPINLVIADRSGETYEDARVTTDLIATLPELQQADRICFLLDGARLASRERRATYSRQFKQLIHALHDNGALKATTTIEVLVTKLDDLSIGDDVDEQLSYLGQYEKSLVAEFRELKLDIECHRICALPKRDSSLGFVGLQEALARWTRPPLKLDVRPVPNSKASRQLDRLYAKSVRRQK